MNFSSLSEYFKNPKLDSISYFCDGMLMSLAVSALTSRKIQRCSFDFGSIASLVLESCVIYDHNVYIVGASEDEIELFVKKLSIKFPLLKVCGFSNGYFCSNRQTEIFKKIIDSNTNTVIVGLGAGKQESFLIDLYEFGFNGLGFSCGGFIRQEANSSVDYYPDYINNFNLRFVYRMYKEPHTIPRYLFKYPLNIIRFLLMSITKKLVLNCT